MSHTSEDPIPPLEGDVAAAEPAMSRVMGLAFVVAVLVALSVATHNFPAFAFAFLLVASVMLHETGHFITAKWSGMKVTEYFFGFGPRLWSVRKGETEYGIKALPFGGYVKIVGMSNVERDIAPEDEARTYRQQSYPKRLLVAVAGIITHFILAFLLLMVMWTAIGVPEPTVQIGSISTPSPAQAAGFQLRDKIVSLEGRAIHSWDDLPPVIQTHPGQPLTFVVERGGQDVTLTVTPADTNPDGEKVGFVGIGSAVVAERVNPVTAVFRSSGDLGRLTVGAIQALGSFFSPASLSNYGSQLSGSSSKNNSGTSANDNRPVSVIGVERLANEAGLFDFFALLVMLNVFVAIVNIVPLPPLDGGHIAIATYERIRSRHGQRYHADAQKLVPIAAAVLLLLVFLGATSLWLDITHPITNPFH